MDNRREFIKKAVLFGGVLSTTSLNSQVLDGLNHSAENPGDGEIFKFSGNPTGMYRPLDPVSLKGLPECSLAVLDGSGVPYIKADGVKDNFSFMAGGALGTHLIILTDKKNRFLDSGAFLLDAKTEIEDEDGFYKALLETLYYSMIKEFGVVDTAWIEGKFYRYFVSWLRDHVHTMKGMKYFYPKLKSAIDLYANYQREDGMIWDNITPRDKLPNDWERRFSYGDFIKIIDDSRYELKRIPVENDVEYLFLEGIYYTWKATGDHDWMKSMLDRAIKAVNYSFSSPYRWSEKYRLLKRGYTIDTWDFQSSFDVARSGDPMVIKLDKTEFGIMYGDNTGMAAGLKYLSTMLAFAGRNEEAEKYDRMSDELIERLNSLSWNGQFFTHHVPENPSVRRDFGVDTDSQVSLSNAYSINRTATHEQAQAIIRTYQRIRKEMPGSSPGEWYTIYPPFERGFGDHNGKWEYMNGGVISIVSGELAHGAFEHGFETYGVDILKRVKHLSETTGDYLHCTYKGAMPETPSRSFTTLSLEKTANTDTSGKGSRGVPGWTGEGNNDLHEFPSGRRTFEDIPFDLVNPAINDRKACLGISWDDHYSRQAVLPVNASAKSVYLLHTMGRGSMPAGMFTLNYTDGSHHVVFIQGDRIGNWWYPSVRESTRGPVDTVVGWRGKNDACANVGVYLTGIDNPHPNKPIREIGFEAFENGTKWMILGVTLCDAPVFFTPPVVSYGIPDNWGSAANVYALLEGLAGIKDEGVAYDKALMAPRWAAAGINNVRATVKYEASGGYLSYDYHADPDGKMITVLFTSSGNETNCKILIPDALSVVSVNVDDAPQDVKTESIENSVYLLLNTSGRGVRKIKVNLR